jgi:MYXO-CTERM domain-containing protein
VQTSARAIDLPSVQPAGGVLPAEDDGRAVVGAEAEVVGLVVDEEERPPRPGWLLLLLLLLLLPARRGVVFVVAAAVVRVRGWLWPVVVAAGARAVDGVGVGVAICEISREVHGVGPVICPVVCHVLLHFGPGELCAAQGL